MFTVFLLSYSLNSHESLGELKKAARTFVNNFLFSQTPTGDSVTQKKKHNTCFLFFGSAMLGFIHMQCNFSISLVGGSYNLSIYAQWFIRMLHS